VVLLIGSNVLNVAIASLATIAGIEYFDSFGAGIATGLSAIAITLLCDLFPKSFGISHRKLVAQSLAYPLFFCYILCYPLASLFAYIERFLQKKMGTASPNIVSEEEIRIMAELGLEHGEIDREEREMIENIFEFDNIPVGDIMTPKKKIDALSGDVPIAQIAYHVSQSGFSRFPVYEGNPDQYIGYVHTNDVMRVLNSDDREKPLSLFISPLTQVDEKLPIQGVFRLMTKDRSHMSLVHKAGKPGKIIGLVTMENVLEEIVGEIEDEGDRRAKHIEPRLKALAAASSVS
ncbi:MAG: hemolysin family protein, partial [Patescibacteria group bacterium]